MQYTEGWKYRLARFVRHKIPGLVGHNAVLKTSAGRTVARLDENGTLTLLAGFAWNGADCFPDTRAILRASAVHDALLQMLGAGSLGADDHGLTKCRIDAAFRYLYYNDLLVVAARSGPWGWWRRKSARLVSEKAFRAVRKWGDKSGMKPAEIKEAP